MLIEDALFSLGFGGALLIYEIAKARFKKLDWNTRGALIIHTVQVLVFLPLISLLFAPMVPVILSYIYSLMPFHETMNGQYTYLGILTGTGARILIGLSIFIYQRHLIVKLKESLEKAKQREDHMLYNAISDRLNKIDFDQGAYVYELRPRESDPSRLEWRLRPRRSDKAMMVDDHAKGSDHVGGIDLSARSMGLQIKGEDKEMSIPASQEYLEDSNIQGFAPRITSIQNVDLSALLGLTK